jgi:hypothetical protein
MRVVEYWTASSILISLEGTELRLHHTPLLRSYASDHGIVTEGSAVLTLEQAESLAQDLLNACRIYRKIEDELTELEEDDEQETKEDVQGGH